VTLASGRNHAAVADETIGDAAGFCGETLIETEDRKMANGWARDGAVQEQIDDTVADAVKLARLRLAEGAGSAYCEDCGEQIPEARRKALPGSCTCIDCQTARDANRRQVGINRRGSKDSQLR
jgi:phage/conjugal plasmid C-4 type zinc finger TraR family protein